ncbi:hypothetical protein BB559_001314 [Furculomyces boomerangus]|uniref:GPI ethanolamine phosphate transferase 2 n=1 Tax=Furculomyces boomerangus TaxID=61424 RepID=A0A2T9Z2C7_9FUNG|nr:hypothetical protein BB559_001314 [Furculomyces boomerangus]
MNGKSTAFVTSIAVLLKIIGICLFIKGFFPIKQQIKGKSTWEALIKDSIETTNVDEIPASTHDKLVLMVVDALRNDFVFGNDSCMNFTKGLIDNKSALGYTAFAKVPTVTMPRIKALMTGTIPSYVDAVTNLLESHKESENSSDQEDSVIWQLVNNKKKNIHMFGDDTWLRLFPNSFKAHDGTTSFYVFDTTEVDNNVTRHIDSLFTDKKDDEHVWDGVILHYLGLDHIGHLEGPKSKMMCPKQTEMDGIVSKLYNNIVKSDSTRVSQSGLKSKPTLMVLLGDHGMNEIGNHGGSSEGEVSPAMVFISPSIKWNADMKSIGSIDQTDLVPTLSFMLGFPIPQNNLGVVIEEMFSDRTERELVQIYELNALSIRRIVLANYDIKPSNRKNKYSIHECKLFETDIERLECIFDVAKENHLNINQKILEGNISQNEINSLRIKLVGLYKSYCLEAHKVISETFGGYNLDSMLIGISCIFASALLFIFTRFWSVLETDAKKSSQDSFSKRFSIKTIYFGVLIIYGFSLFSTSFVEEEHMFWFYVSQGLLMLKFLHSMSSRDIKKAIKMVFLMVLIRILYFWNNLGVKWATETFSVRLWLTSGSNSSVFVLWSLFLASVGSLCMYLSYLHTRIYYPTPSPLENESENQNIKKNSGVLENRQIIDEKNNPEIVIQSEQKRSLLERKPKKPNRLIESLKDPKNIESFKRFDRMVSGEDETVVYLSRIHRASIYFGMNLMVVYKLETGLELSKYKIFESLPQESKRKVFDFLRPFLIPYKIIKFLCPPNLDMTVQSIYLLSIVSTILAVVVYKHRITSTNTKSKVSFSSAYFTDLMFSLLPVVLLVAKTHNSALIAIMFLIHYFALTGEYVGYGGYWIVVMYTLMNFFHYALGNTNSLSSLDLSSAYTGIGSLATNHSFYKFLYQATIVKLIYFSNFVSPILYFIGILSLSPKNTDLSSNNETGFRTHVFSSIRFILGSNTIILLFLLSATTLLRTHLFIWSVFAPKILYAFGWTILLFSMSLYGTIFSLIA